MGAKLTLKIDERVIKSAKRFAKLHHTSLSKMTENYFKTVAAFSCWCTSRGFVMVSFIR